MHFTYTGFAVLCQTTEAVTYYAHLAMPGPHIPASTPTLSRVVGTGALTAQGCVAQEPRLPPSTDWPLSSTSIYWTLLVFPWLPAQTKSKKQDSTLPSPLACFKCGCVPNNRHVHLTEGTHLLCNLQHLLLTFKLLKALTTFIFILSHKSNGYLHLSLLFPRNLAEGHTPSMKCCLLDALGFS